MNAYFMHHDFMGPLAFGGFGGIFPALAIVLAAWSIVWKGLALWHAARNNQGWWFLALLIINTVGILEIVYLFGFRADRATTPLVPGREGRPAAAAPVKESSPEA